MTTNSDGLVDSLKRILSGREHSPEYIARGAGIGLLVSFTPSVGIQIPALIGLRVVFERIWPFHLPIALLTTLPTNALTVPFLYYLYVVTGRVMLGRTENLRGFEVFSNRMEQTGVEHLSWYEALWQSAYALLSEFGLPLFVGSIPWAIAVGLCGYYITLKFVTKRRLQKETA